MSRLRKTINQTRETKPRATTMSTENGELRRQLGPGENRRSSARGLGLRVHVKDDWFVFRLLGMNRSWRQAGLIEFAERALLRGLAGLPTGRGQGDLRGPTSDAGWPAVGGKGLWWAMVGVAPTNARGRGMTAGQLTRARKARLSARVADGLETKLQRSAESRNRSLTSRAGTPGKVVSRVRGSGVRVL